MYIHPFWGPTLASQGMYISWSAALSSTLHNQHTDEIDI